jgi:hypothetical protein
MTTASDTWLDRYRARTFRLTETTRVRRREEAIAFVKERGFIFFWPIKGVTFPSLWTAVAGNRPVADKHDDPGHVTWGWKDEMLGKREWYYAKVLRGKATIIALEILPYFYALSENYGEPEKDYLQLYEDGLLSRESKLIYETILREGPLDTVRLRRKIQMTRRKSDSPFARGMTQLQRDFKILPVGIARTGGWRYSFIYEAVHRYYPDLPRQARAIRRSEAQRVLMRRAFASVGAALEGDLRKLFQWKPREIKRTLARLVEGHSLATIPGKTPSKTQYVWREVDLSS